MSWKYAGLAAALLAFPLGANACRPDTSHWYHAPIESGVVQADHIFVGKVVAPANRENGFVGRMRVIRQIKGEIPQNFEFINDDSMYCFGGILAEGGIVIGLLSDADRLEIIEKAYALPLHAQPRTGLDLHEVYWGGKEEAIRYAKLLMERAEGGVDLPLSLEMAEDLPNGDRTARITGPQIFLDALSGKCPESMPRCTASVHWGDLPSDMPLPRRDQTVVTFSQPGKYLVSGWLGVPGPESRNADVWFDAVWVEVK